MIDGFVFVCPSGSYMGADQYEKVFCSSNGVSAWQIMSVTDFAAEIGTASGASPSSSTFPDLSIADANQIGIAFMLVCATAWVWVKLRSVA